MSRSQGVVRFRTTKLTRIQQLSKITAAKKAIKKKYKNTSEHKDRFSHNADAGYRHHIIQQTSFPQFADYKENIINITAEQHRQAHLIGISKAYNTSQVNLNYQKKLLSKLADIETSLINNENFYELEKFIELTNVKKPYGPGLNINSNTNIKQIRKKLS